MRVYVSLGSNQGCAHSYFCYALGALSKRVGVVLGYSEVFRSPAMYVKDQAMFSNVVVCVKTVLPPFKLLRCLLEIEKECGRKRLIDKGPRTLDADIIFYGDRRICMPYLEIPHRLWQERAFVILPLYDVMVVLEPWNLEKFGVEDSLRILSRNSRRSTRRHRRSCFGMRRWTPSRGYGRRQCCCGLCEGVCRVDMEGSGEQGGVKTG